MNQIDSTTFWRHPRFDDLCLLKARFTHHRYELHTHPTYVIALIIHGCERLRIGARKAIAPAGTVIIVHPEECHDGEAGVENGWAYRTLYPSVSLMSEVTQELGREGPPVFSRQVIDDPDLAHAIAAAHRTAEQPASDDAEAALLLALRCLIIRHADQNRGSEAIKHSGAQRRFSTYVDAIDGNPGGDLDLRSLGDLAGVTRFQVIRDFKRMTGLTPGAFVRNRRLRLASRLIEQGATLVDAAIVAGFADQSHLSRSFRSTHGITPTMFRRAFA